MLAHQGVGVEGAGLDAGLQAWVADEDWIGAAVKLADRSENLGTRIINRTALGDGQPQRRGLSGRR